MWFDPWSAVVRVLGGRAVVTSRPSLLQDGRPLPAALRQQRVTMSELRQAVGAAGNGDLAAVAAVVLGSDGSLAVVPTGHAGDGSALEDVIRSDG